MTSSSIPVLAPRVVYGLRTDNIKGNALFASDEEIIYPVGGLLSIHNYNQRKQKFIKLNGKGSNVNQICLSPNRKLVAIAEEADERTARPIITLYDPWTCKKKRAVAIPAEKEILAKCFVSICFSADSKQLYAVADEPDWVMYTFRADKGKIESTTRANNSNGTGTVVQIAANPTDYNLVVLIGNQLFRIISYAENMWRQYGFNKADMINVTTCAWLSQDRLLAGTEDGKLLFLESGELKAVYWASDLPIMSLKMKDDLAAGTGSQTNIDLAETQSNEEGIDVSIKNLITFSKGFAFGYTTGMVILYEKETQYKYRKRNVFRIPVKNVERETGEFDDEINVTIMNVVNCISVNISEDRMIATCKANQIYVTRLWGPDITVNPETIFVELGLPLHHGSIVDMAVCAWKSILMTAGGWDRSLRIWNYDTDNLDLCRSYLEDIHALALHPSGLFAVVGFSDKLRFLTILIDDFATTREFPIRSCKLCNFSKLGHLFAAVNGNVIQVYSSISFEHMFNLKGHNGLVTGMSWMHDDYKLSSCGTEGAVYEWQISTTRRICETIIKSCQFTDVAMTNDGKSTYAVGSDGRLREIMNSNVHRDVVITANGLDGVALSKSDMMLFSTGSKGVVYSIKLPILDNAEMIEYTVHGTKVNRILISYDDKYLFTGSIIGTMTIWKILNTEGKAVKLDKEFAPSTEILISKADLEEKMNIIKDLQVRMHELQTEHAYQMRQTETMHEATVKEVHEGYCEAIEELKEKNENLETEHIQEINTINTDIIHMKENHEHFVQKLEANYNEKLIFEYNKYQALEDKMAKMRSHYNKELEDLAKAKKDSETTITNDFLQTLQERQIQLEEILEESKQRTKEHEVIKQQIEDDADREIYELKLVHQSELREEQDLNVKLRTETQLIKKKLSASQKEIDDLKHTVNNQENEQLKLKSVIVGLEKDINDLKKEIAERDSTIQDKEKRISELKHKNQELEKFKFILDFKIEELKSQIEPRDRTIQEQTEQITDMVNELENLQKVIMSLELQLNEVRGKLKGADNEIKREITKNRTVKAALKTIRSDIHHASGLIQDIPNLQKAVRSMYHKYNADKDFIIAQGEDQEAKNEFLRQRDFLERTVFSLKNRVQKKNSTVSTDNVRLIQENSYLLAETNVLRKDLKLEQRTNKKMQAVMGLSKTGMTARESEKKLTDALQNRNEIAKEYEDVIDREQKLLNAMKVENERLLSKIVEEKPIEAVSEAKSASFRSSEFGSTQGQPTTK